jgi:glycosyltransferase involved in cell wall biosynthesis
VSAHPLAFDRARPRAAGHVVFVTHKYPPSIGGMERQSYELVSRVGRHRPALKIVCHRRLAVPHFLVHGAAARLRALGDAADIALVHMNDGLMALAAERLRAVRPVPMVATLHGLDVVFPNEVYQQALRERLRSLDKVVVVSEATRRECLARGTPEHAIEVIPNGVDEEWARTPTDPGFLASVERFTGLGLRGRRILLSIGRPIERKGFRWFAREVLPRLPDDVVYVVAGAHRSDQAARSMMRLLPSGVARQIRLGVGLAEYAPDEFPREAAGRLAILGRRPLYDLIQLCRHASLFVMPNVAVPGDMEGFGLTALEASAAGALVLASRLEGIPDAIHHGKNGFLVAAQDADEWVAETERLLAFDDRRRCTTSASFQAYTLRHRRWDDVAARYAEVFNSLIG